MLKYLNNLGLFGWLLTLVGFIVLVTVFKWVAVAALFIVVIAMVTKYIDKIRSVIRMLKGEKL